MKYWYLRTTLFLYSLLVSVATFAQEDDDEEDEVVRRSDMDLDMEPLDYSPINLSIGDIFAVALVLLTAYLLGKVWKGCAYIFLVIGLVIYLLHKYFYP